MSFNVTHRVFFPPSFTRGDYIFTVWNRDVLNDSLDMEPIFGCVPTGSNNFYFIVDSCPSNMYVNLARKDGEDFTELSSRSYQVRSDHEQVTITFVETSGQLEVSINMLKREDHCERPIR